MGMQGKYFFVKTQKEIRKVYLSDIICAENEFRRVKISMDTGKVYIYGRMRDLLPLLDERFLQCHQSYALNMDRIDRMVGQAIYLEKGITITLGRESFRKAKNAFISYLGECHLAK